MWDVRDVGCSGCGMFEMWDVGDVGCSGCGMFGMWDVRDVGCWGCGMFGMWDVRDVGCAGCGMFRMWDVGCGMFAGMWDVDLQNARIFRLALEIIFLRNKYFFLQMAYELSSQSRKLNKAGVLT